MLDPRAVPVVGHDAHLPALDAARLEADAIRARFARLQGSGLHVPELAGDAGADAGVGPVREPLPAAVLVPLVLRPGGLQVLLTLRAAHLRDHAGQVAFPGGRVEPHDADAVATALREAEEEIGLAPVHVEVLGTLAQYATVTRFVVTPVVALVRPPFELRLDRFEVDEAFEVPLAHLMDPSCHRRHVFSFDGSERQFLSMPWDRHFIWGATAAMLRNLYGVLAQG